jgi:hypothetical protein
MHIVGKILIFLLLVSAGFGFIMAARLVKTRGDWMDKVQTAKVNNEKTAQNLVAARQDFEEARAQLEREMLRWDRYLVVRGVFDPTTNAIIANADAKAGFRPNTEYYAFLLGDKGQSTYVGSFNAVAVGNNESQLKATFPVRKEDVANWSGENWRVRTAIPNAFLSQFVDLQAKLVSNDEILKKQEKNLATQAELAAAARDQRDTRVAELLGAGGGAANSPGLVAEINQTDDQRNASLMRVDDLRRRIGEAQAHVKSLIQENNNLANVLPGQSRGQQAKAGRPAA